MIERLFVEPEDLRAVAAHQWPPTPAALADLRSRVASWLSGKSSVGSLRHRCGIEVGQIQAEMFAPSLNRVKSLPLELPGENPSR